MLVLSGVTVNLEFQTKYFIAKLFMKVHTRKGLKSQENLRGYEITRSTDLKAIK